MIKSFTNLLINPFDLPINGFVQIAILLMIWFFLFPIAWNLVSNMYSKGTVSGSSEGSRFHWLFRIGLFLLFWLAIRLVVKAYKFVTVYWQIILMLGVSVLGTALICFATIIIMRKIKGRAAK